jgi:apolipoprotein N-acyltransferase
LLAPASDWRAIKDLHQQQAVFRALENGVSLLRPARWGVSVATDAMGRVAARLDHFATEDRMLLAHVPMRGTRTLYARFGDLFAWACVAVLLALVAWRILR